MSSTWGALTLRADERSIVADPPALLHGPCGARCPIVSCDLSIRGSSYTDTERDIIPVVITACMCGSLVQVSRAGAVDDAEAPVNGETLAHTGTPRGEGTALSHSAPGGAAPAGGPTVLR